MSIRYLFTTTRHCTSTCLFFFFNDSATTKFYTLSLHDALPIYRCVIMRMRNGDGADAAARVYFCDGFIVKECDAIPEQISAGGLQEQCALTDGEFRVGPNA